MRKLHKFLWRWQFLGLLLIASAFLGAGWEWWQGPESNTQNVRSASAEQRFGSDFVLVPNSFQSLPAMLTGANGRLEPEGRKQIRLAEEARLRTRQLVKPDRSNVDCAYMKCIALTYDDGPEPGLTLELLKTLQKKQAVATFFVLGSRAQHQRHVLKRIVAGHSEIGNHTWSHHDLTHMPNQQISDEIDRTNNLIREVVGFQPKMVRPPMGRYDRRVVEVAHMAVGLWSVDPRDWRDRDAQTVYLRAISAAGPGKVIILHDMHPTTIQASTWIIDELQRQGYVLVTMSELFGITNDNVQEFSGRILLYR